MTTYPAKGAMVLREEDGSFYTGYIEEDDDVIGRGLICTATESLMDPLNQDSNFEKNTPLLLHSDSDNAITTVMNSRVAPKMNWISTRYHLIRDCIRKNLNTLVNIPSKANPADILTKAKPHPVFEENRKDLLHMRSPSLAKPE